MIVALLFCIAVICMVIGHVLKVKRWGLLISIYEEPYEPNLLNAMTFGHTLNAILPIRIGDIVRVFWAGRKLKNAYSFSLATVIVDLYVDVITVGAMFLGLSLIGKGGDKLLEMAHFYMCAFIIIIPLTILCIYFRKFIKRIIRVVASLFNEKIEFKLLYVSYLCIASLKDIIKNIQKSKFILYTIGIWLGYIASYVIFAEAIQRYGFYYATSDVFTELFSGASLYHIEKEAVPMWSAYLLLPLGICWMISMLGKRKNNLTSVYRATLPQMNSVDRLAFLKTYYEDENRNNIQSYLEINRDVTVVEDNSAGSNASTLLVMKPDGNMFYRKYAFNENGIKLQEQIEWIEEHQKDIPLPIITGKRNGGNYVTYDMHSYGGTTDFFRFIHTMPLENSWVILQQSLDDIRSGLHTKNIRTADIRTIKQYIESKVEKNLKIIRENNRYIRGLEQYDSILVNGNPLRTLNHYSEMLNAEHMQKVFEHDLYSDVHGDLTIENIICVSDPTEIDELEYSGKIRPSEYYFIDPNTGNIHNSPYLDYGKLLQSLHGNYEFLMMVSSVKIEKSQVNFMMTKSEAYGKLYHKYNEYLNHNFSKEQVLSIYYHEIIHWLRLLPYKVRKDEKNAVVFYTGLLKVLNNVWEVENGNKK
jgi:hypothetical protein